MWGCLCTGARAIASCWVVVYAPVGCTFFVWSDAANSAGAQSPSCRAGGTALVWSHQVCAYLQKKKLQRWSSCYSCDALIPPPPTEDARPLDVLFGERARRLGVVPPGLQNWCHLFLAQRHRRAANGDESRSERAGDASADEECKTSARASRARLLWRHTV